MSGEDDLRLLFVQYIAQTAFNPGFGALVANLLYDGTIERRKKLALQENHDAYMEGANQRLFLCGLNAYLGKLFHDIVVACDSWDSVLFVGIKQKQGKVILNPEPGYRIQAGDCAYVICDNSESKTKLGDVEKGTVVKESKKEVPTAPPTKETEESNSENSGNEGDGEEKGKEREKERKEKKKDEDEGYQAKPEYSYHISNSTTTSLEDITVDSIKSVPHWKSMGHILLCGNPNQSNILSELVFELRREYWKVTPIVILSPQSPAQETLEEITSIPEVYYIEGSAGSEADLKKAGADSKKALVLIMGQWSKDGRKRSQADVINKTSVSHTVVRNLLENELSTSAKVITVLGKAASGGPSVDKKEEQLLNSPMHSSASLLSFDIFENLMLKNKDFAPLVALLIKGVITTTRVKDIRAKLGEKSFPELVGHFASSHQQILLGVYHEDKTSSKEDYASYIVTHPTSEDIKLHEEDLLLLLWPTQRYPLCQSLAGTTIVRGSGMLALRRSTGGLQTSGGVTTTATEDNKDTTNTSTTTNKSKPKRQRPRSLTLAASAALSDATKNNGDGSAMTSAKRERKLTTTSGLAAAPPRRSWRKSFGLGKRNLDDQLKEEGAKMKKEEKQKAREREKQKKKEEKARKEKEKKEKKEKKAEKGKEKEKKEKKTEKEKDKEKTTMPSKKVNGDTPAMTVTPPEDTPATPKQEDSAGVSARGTTEGGEFVRAVPTITSKKRLSHMPPPSLRHDEAIAN